MHDIAITTDDDGLAYIDATGNIKYVKDNDAQEKIININAKIGEIPDGKTIKDYVDTVVDSGMTITLF